MHEAARVALVPGLEISWAVIGSGEGWRKGVVRWQEGVSGRGSEEGELKANEKQEQK